MDYNGTIKYLYTQLPMFQRNGPVAYKDSLENSLKLDAIYGSPHKQFKSIHVAGTNGKGSVSHMLASVLQEAGFKTGLYTSPHLKDFRERIKINGLPISKKYVSEWVSNFIEINKEINIQPSFFELTGAMAFSFFADERVDFAVIEVGLGGRLDSTNIISPELGIITNIGLDHTNLLGNTLEKIAFEKAGIIKEKLNVIIGESNTLTKPVFNQVAHNKNANLFFADKIYEVDFVTLGLDQKQWITISEGKIKKWSELKLDLLGIYQQKNVLSVLTAINLLNHDGWNISEENIRSGLANTVKNTGLMGRWQILGNNPLIICDTAHNPDGISMVIKQINNTAYKNLHFIFGTVSDKDPEPVLQLLPQNATYYFVAANTPRSMPANTIKAKANKLGLNGITFKSVKNAFKAAKMEAGKNDLIFIGGSTFVVAEIL